MPAEGIAGSMKKPRPDGGAAKGRSAIILSGHTSPTALPTQDPDFWQPLDGVTLIELRRLWWRLRRLNDVQLPAELGVIVIDGVER